MKIHVQNIAAYAPGLDDWSAMRAALAGETAYDDLATQPLAKIVPQILPANERRRTTKLIKLALHVAEQVTQEVTADVQLATVFAAADGDHEILDRNTHALTLPGHPVSPTNFHNSVHNAPAGYWHIATRSQAFSTSMAAGVASFSSGLLEAGSFCIAEQQPVVFVTYDYPPASVLQTVCDTRYPFAVAMLLQARQDSHSQFMLDIAGNSGRTPGRMAQATFEELRTSNPAARSLPLLHAMANRQDCCCTLPYVNDAYLDIRVTPCQP